MRVACVAGEPVVLHLQACNVYFEDDVIVVFNLIRFGLLFDVHAFLL